MRAPLLLALAAALGCVTPTGVAQHRSVLEALALPRGARVADLGAGGGDLCFRLADAVGPEGIVYAVEVEPAALGGLRERALREGRTNVVVVEAAYDDARLPDSSVDLALVVGTYRRLPNRTAYFEHVKRALRPGGRVAIVELTLGDPLAHPALPIEAIQNELEAAHYALTAKRDLPEGQSLLIFTPSR